MATGDFRQSWERVLEGPKPEGPPVYMPTAQEVRDQWASSPVYGYRDPMPVRLAEFDRWLASVRAEAWDEGERHESEFLDRTGQFCPYKNCNPYRSEKQ